ncbi:hypothetical protein F8388_008242 [Cannabis sativa]|uniref:DC1 domain-containing protein n=1 Tax=Cannabis sativa TaxID=3483 RepID=A0A7J6H7S0_CANSA|nr:hypothetical protein F8388_008242 [Cannabis sativa]KAF4391337.1 hypothetical protein G4B88_016647 [Cannabis sativa]
MYFCPNNHLLFTKYYDYTFPCHVCGLSNITPPFYACELCVYFVHKSCGELPHHLLFHSKHPSHTLTLSSEENYKCNACNSNFSFSPTFKCDSTCNFYLDLKCAMMAPITFKKLYLDQTTTIIQHSTHPHPMKYFHVDYDQTAHCFGCRSLIKSGCQVYVCGEDFDYVLHKSCAELPKEIHYPFHLNHGPLTLNIKYFKWFNDKCNLCNKIYTTIFIFKCNECSFWLCLKCNEIAMRAKRSIKYKYHEHLLCFASDGDMFIDNNNHCDSYDSYCKQTPIILHNKEFSDTSPFTFYCLECDFKSHLLCGPLPSRIEYEYHIHPLILSELFINEESFEDYYCDICEMRRDPRIRIYYCADCKYAADVHCLINEIKNIFESDINNVPLITMGEDLGIAADDEYDDISSERLIDMINALSHEEKKFLRMFYIWYDSSSSSMVKEQQLEKQKHSHNEASESNLEDKDVNWIIDYLSLRYINRRDAFNDNVNVYRLRMFEKKPKFESTDLELKLVTVEGYKIPHPLAPILKRLLSEHGDISSDDGEIKLSKEGKSVIYFILCKTLKRMRDTKIADITIDLLLEWDFNVNFIKESVAFEIDFLTSHVWELIKPIFCGIQAKRLESEIPTMIMKRREKLHQEMIKLDSQLATCENILKTPGLKELCAKASAKKWNSAGEGLF